MIMDSAELVDMIIADAPASEIQDAIKSLAYAKSADLVDRVTPDVAASIFGDEPEEGDPLPEVGDGEQTEVDAELEQEPTTETEE
tara:strand:+ start:261 stop:515 length:255 start_codon:yes stop_codon:yes gene_type:complete